MFQMLISITECKEGVWTGRPDMGFWCNRNPADPVADPTGAMKIKCE